MAKTVEKRNDEIQKKDFEIKRLQSELNKTSASLMKAQMQAEVHGDYYFAGHTYLYDIIISLSLSLCLQYYTSEMMDDSYLTSGQEPLRAREPAEMPHPPPPNQGAGGQYQMHASRH